MSSLPSSQQPLPLVVFLRQTGADRFLAVQDGQLVCLSPESAEAQALYRQIQAALAAGTITPVPLAPMENDG